MNIKDYDILSLKRKSFLKRLFSFYDFEGILQNDKTGVLNYFECDLVGDIKTNIN